MKYTFPIIEKLGGKQSVFNKLKILNRKKRSKADSIRMWMQRGVIPRDATLELMEIAEQEKIQYSSSDFFLTKHNSSD